MSLVCLTALAVGAAALGEQTTKPLSLNECVQIALANNKAISIAEANLRKARAQVRQAKAGDNPQLKVDAEYARQGPAVEFPLKDEETGETTMVQVVSPERKDAKASLNKVLDVFGQVRLGIDIADIQRVIQELELQRTVQQLTLDVKQAYYNVLRAQAQREVAARSVQAAEEHLRIAEVQFKAGTAPKFDVTRAEVEVANRKQDLIAITNAVALAKAVLNNAMGIDVSAPTEVTKVEAPVKSTEAKAATALNMEKAYKQRPEVLQSDLAVKLSGRAVELNKRGLWPTLMSTGTLGYNWTTTAFSKASAWSAGLAISIPIWDGGITKAKVDEAKSDLEAARARLDQVKLGVALDVRSAVLSLIESADRVGTAAENVRQAEEALRLAQVRYQAGVSTGVEVTDAEVALTLARTNEVNATYDYQIALARLERAVGAQPELGNG